MLTILPITSVPVVAQLLGSDSVASPSILILALLVIIWLVPWIVSGKPLPYQTIPLLVFVCVVLISSALSFFIEIPPYKGIPIFRNDFHALATLAIGVCFFFIASTFPQDNGLLKKSVQVINWSGFIMLLWGVAQGIAWFGFGHYPNWMFRFQGFISAGTLYRQRVTALALEPSWLAHELNMLYFPIWLSATVKKQSFHSFRIWKFSFENLLFTGGVIALLLTFSRIGLLAFLLMCGYLLLKMHAWIVEKIGNKLMKNRRTKNKGKTHKRVAFSISAILVVVYMVTIAIGLIIFSHIDPRMASLFDFSLNKENSILKYFNDLRFGDRIIYWMAGWETFGAYPFFGVGLGNAGFFFPESITPYGWTLLEVRKLIHRTSILLNIKSLWIRLLAETGIIGFSFFIGWLYSQARIFVQKDNSSKNINNTLCLAGIFVLCALLAEGFSIDSFAMPYLWVSLGLATAACSSKRKSDLN
ncbi:MAG TPA: O-antigen ligase family protein [Anaerolineae bacterium]|nr:O-antigen ligase family protein [Anaerolineae bacterium]